MPENSIQLSSDESESNSFLDANFSFSNKSKNFEILKSQNLNFNHSEGLGGELDDERSFLRESKFDGSEDKSSPLWRSAHYQYGINYKIMSKEAVLMDKYPTSIVEGVEKADYCRKLYECRSDQNSLLAPIQLPQLEWGQKCEDNLAEYDWCLQTDSENFNELTILDLQSTICASLNSKQTLVWLIGVNASCEVVGIHMDRRARDTFRHSYEFAISHEFLPALNPSLVSLRFLPVSNPMQHELFVIELTVAQTVDTIYQLSHGRIYCVLDNRPKLLETFNDAYQILLSNSEQTYTCPYHDKRSSTSTFYLGILAGVVISLIAIGSYTR